MSIESTVKINEQDVKVVLPDHHTLLEPGPHKPGQLVKVRAVAEGKDQMHLGIYMGNMALGYSMLYDAGTLRVKHAYYNPAIYVPALARIVYGMEVWWDFIKTKEELDDLRAASSSSITKTYRMSGT